MKYQDKDLQNESAKNSSEDGTNGRIISPEEGQKMIEEARAKRKEFRQYLLEMEKKGLFKRDK